MVGLATGFLAGIPANTVGSVTNFPLAAGNGLTVSSEAMTTTSPALGNWQNMSTWGDVTGHFKAAINWADFQVTGFTTEFKFNVRYLFEAGSTLRQLQVQALGIGDALANSEITGTADSTLHSDTTGWIVAPTTGSFIYELGFKADSGKGVRISAAQLLIRIRRS